MTQHNSGLTTEGDCKNLNLVDYEAILESELVAALGCTEPIAIALCTAKAADLLRASLEDAGKLEEGGDLEIEAMKLILSGNVIKNAHSVFVPNSGGQKGIPYAAALGALAGDASRGLEVLEGVDEAGRAKAQAFLGQDKLSQELAEGVSCLYISCELEASGHKAVATISDDHDKFIYLEQGGQVLLDNSQIASAEDDALHGLKSQLNFPAIWEFGVSGQADESDKIQELIQRQIDCNSAIADTGFEEAWGQEVGRNILAHKRSLEDELVAYAAAASDARMAGCAMPVVINSGSGNQGMTLSLPLIRYAKEENKSDQDLFRAFFIANCTAIYLKTAIGKLSAYCGAVSAAAACAAGFAYLDGQDYEVAEMTLINALSISSGLVCDGATGSCAAKIAVSLQSAFLGLRMAKAGQVFPAGEGLGGSSLEVCVENIGRLASPGMVQTDVEIMNMIIEDK